MFIDYPNINDTALVKRIVGTFATQLFDKAVAQGIDLPFIYTPDANAGQDPLGAYGATELAFLKDVSRKYDPGRVMQRLQNDGYLVGV